MLKHDQEMTLNKPVKLLLKTSQMSPRIIIQYLHIIINYIFLQMEEFETLNQFLKEDEEQKRVKIQQNTILSDD